ncbi:MAG: hypothetical protein JHC87_06785 [Thermoleophilaceae bacterium]|nr:hypothetical protein [Thermoleophilaceae bacterium]
MQPLTKHCSISGKRRSYLLAVCALMLAIFAGGCGDSNSTSANSEAADSKPKLTIPQGSVEANSSSNTPTDATGSTGSAGDTSTGTGGGTDSATGGSTPTPQGQGNANGGTTPNPSGGARYDQFCKENPGACGN